MSYKSYGTYRWVSLDRQILRSTSVSRSLSRFQAVVLGLIVMTSLSLATGGLFLIGGRGWYGSDSFHLRAGFREIRGVEVGTRVRLKGMDAGEVVAVLSPDQLDDPVVLRLRLKGEYRRLIRPDAVVRIESDGLVGGKVLEIKPAPTTSATPADGLVAEDQLLQGDSSDLMENVAAALNGLRDGKGSLGQFLTNTQAHDAFVDMIHQGFKTLAKSEETATTLQQDADALKRVPVLGSYVEDPAALLQRYKSDRQRRIFNSNDLFEPGRAVLTAEGRQDLDGIAPWLKSQKRPGSDVVIVAYADPHSINPQAARALTRQESETVCDYLKTKQGVQKIGWFSTRKVTPLGLGVEPPPMPESESLPPDRLEIQIFTP
jgi:phospholipid/cholesterol/gamma-HCH transport system substrate-binding protein